MVVDTGSELSWLSCRPGTAGSSFNPSLSTSYISIPCNSSICTEKTAGFQVPANYDEKKLCHYIYSYLDMKAGELMSFPALKIPGFVFGCSVLVSMAENPGLKELNQRVLSLISQLTFMYKFSYCIAASPAATDVLLFGGSPFRNSLQYTGLINMSLPLRYFNRAAYTVKSEEIKVGDKLLPIPKSVFLPDHTGAGQTMINSGTRFTLLLGGTYTPLREAFVQQDRPRIIPVTGNVVFQGILDLCYDFPASLFSSSRLCSRCRARNCFHASPTPKALPVPKVVKFTASYLGILI